MLVKGPLIQWCKQLQASALYNYNSHVTCNKVVFKYTLTLVYTAKHGIELQVINMFNDK